MLYLGVYQGRFAASLKHLQQTPDNQLHFHFAAGPQRQQLRLDTLADTRRLQQQFTAFAQPLSLG